MKTSLTQLTCSVVYLCAGQVVLAQTIPDAGALQKQTEQGLKALTPSATLKRREALPEPMVQAGATTVTVSQFKLVGNTLLNDAPLLDVAAPYLHRPLTFAQLQQAADAVAGAYRQAGWVVQAYLPKQEIIHGVVTLQIVEAVFGEVRIQGKPATRVPATQLKAIVQAAQETGQPLHANRIDRALLLLDDLPGVSVVGNLVEGTQHQETDLALIATDEALATGNVSYDNAGSRATGTERLSLNASLNSPFRMGDALALNLLKTQGSEYQRLAYNLPVGADGLRAGVHASYLHYNLLSSFSTSGYKGMAQSKGVDLSYPLLRSRLQNIHLALSWDSKQFDNWADTGTLTSMSRYRLSVYNASLNLNQIDGWGGGGANTASLGVSQGDVNLNGSANQISDASGSNTAGRFTKLTLNLSRQQSVNENLTWFIASNWQTATKNLDSSEKIYLGGANGVRAFPTSEGGGTAGRTLTNELRRRLDERFTLSLFHDYGHVKAYRNNQRNDSTGLNSGAASPNSYSLQGWGASLAWQGPSGIDLKATAARRTRSNPLAQTNGTDTDGTIKETRLWVNASMSF